jgi:hypothetical protein
MRNIFFSIICSRVPCTVPGNTVSNFLAISRILQVLDVQYEDITPFFATLARVVIPHRPGTKKWKYVVWSPSKWRRVFFDILMYRFEDSYFRYTNSVTKKVTAFWLVGIRHKLSRLHRFVRAVYAINESVYSIHAYGWSYTMCLDPPLRFVKKSLRPNKGSTRAISVASTTSCRKTENERKGVLNRS